MAELSIVCLNWWTDLFFISLIGLNLLTHEASGILIVKPQNRTVLAGQVTTLNCSTSLAADVHWYYGQTYVYAGKKLQQPYNESFKVEVYQHDSSTAYNLVFLSTKPEDAGTYNCRENQGRGNMSSAEMTVFTAGGNATCQSNMKPDGVVISNDCNIDPDEVQLSCSLTFYGKNPPQLEWKNVPDNGGSVAKTECQIANNRVTCNASVIGDQKMNHSSYVCQTTGSTQLNIKLCTIEVKNLIYAFSATTSTKSTVGHEVQCSSNTSQPCQYKWKHSEVIVSVNRSITPVNTGLYQCVAHCNIRGKSCIVLDYVYISQSDESTSCSIGCVLAICFAILLLIVSFSFWFFLKKERDKFQQLSSDLERNLKENGTQQEQKRLIQQSRDRKTADDEGNLETKENETQEEQDRLVQPSTEMNEPILIRTIKPNEELQGKAVFGITILGNELFALIMGCPEIEVFDLQKLEFKRKCSLNDKTLEILWDIQSSSKLECLYVVDEKEAEEQSADIIKIDSLGTVQKKWSAKCTCKVCRLSITREFNVIVTSLHNHSIREYAPDGDLICEIKLTADVGIVRPWMTLKQSTNEYIVSHGDRGDLQHRVCIIDLGGILKYSFGGRKGSSDEQLNVPIHMAAFSDGRILVTDTDNSRVLLLSPKLEFVAAFFSQSLRFPNRICLDEQNKRMFVSDNQWISNMKPWTDGKILVYDMSSVQDSLHK